MHTTAPLSIALSPDPRGEVPGSIMIKREPLTFWDMKPEHGNIFFRDDDERFSRLSQNTL